MSGRRDISRLYQRPLQSKRTGPLFNAFSYPTKIDPEALAVFVAAHTRPGEVVLDPFGGSGSTGVAVCLCDRPTGRMRELALAAGVRPVWGPRQAVLHEISTLGALLARVLTDPPDPALFSAAATRLLDRVEQRFGWAYEAAGPDGEPGRVRHIIWSEVLQTPCCGHQLTLWEAAVRLAPLALRKRLRCPACSKRVQVARCQRVLSSAADPVTGEPGARRLWQPARVYGKSSGKTWSRPPTAADLALIERVEQAPVVPGTPTGPIVWGDLHRSGYHSGINRFHQLYTHRNLRAVGELWRSAGRTRAEVRDALRLLTLSYNATHSTLMTRVVLKKRQQDFVITGAQSGVMYVSGLPVEKNVIDGVRRKLKTFAAAFALIHGSRSQVTVVNDSSTSLDLGDNSVDYVFTDPPFGGFIPYAEVNQVNEAWLGRLTDRSQEVIISPAQGKGPGEYARLMTEVFSEVSRVLRPAGRATVVFHASRPAVWHALGEAFRLNGLSVERTSVLDKTQVSFKQVVHEGGTRGDALFLLRPSGKARARSAADQEALAETLRLLEQAAGEDPAELAPRRMFSRYVAACVEHQRPVALTAPEFYACLEAARSRRARSDR